MSPFLKEGFSKYFTSLQCGTIILCLALRLVCTRFEALIVPCPQSKNVCCPYHHIRCRNSLPGQHIRGPCVAAGILTSKFSMKVETIVNQPLIARNSLLSKVTKAVANVCQYRMQCSQCYS